MSDTIVFNNMGMPMNSKSDKYGKLYNWYTIKDSRGICPKGFHVPSKQEWDKLVSFLGGNLKTTEKIKSNSDWNNFKYKN